MKIGVLGGTYNPIHKAHLQMAELARDTLALDRVLLMVAADPPHKTVDAAVDAETRLMMARLGCAGVDRVDACDLELRRGGKSYTVDTLTELHRLRPGDALYLIVGSDMLSDLPLWWQPERIAELAQIAYVPRSGQESGDEAAAERLRRDYGAKVWRLPTAVDAISSTVIRARLMAGRPVDGMMPMAALLYCMERGLYAPGEVKETLEALGGRISGKRLRHSAGCAVAAARLAESWGADPQKARLAAILHDCAKNEPAARLFLLSGDDTEILAVQHAFAGAVLAKMDYGVTDDEVLRAIRRHCTGETNMSLLDKIIYLADVIEPTRSYEGVDELRRRAAEGPDRAMLYALTRSAAYIHKTKKAGGMHPATLRAICYFEERTKEEET